MSGADRHDETEDNVINLYVDDYYTVKKVVGYTLLSSKYIRVNTKYFDTNSNKRVGSNLLHEYGHLVGFSHDFRRTARRPFSICYQLNKAYEECHDRLIGPREGSLAKVKVGRWFPKYKWVRK